MGGMTEGEALFGSSESASVDDEFAEVGKGEEGSRRGRLEGFWSVEGGQEDARAELSREWRRLHDRAGWSEDVCLARETTTSSTDGLTSTNAALRCVCSTSASISSTVPPSPLAAPGSESVFGQIDGFCGEVETKRERVETVGTLLSLLAGERTSDGARATEGRVVSDGTAGEKRGKERTWLPAVKNNLNVVLLFLFPHANMPLDVRNERRVIVLPPRCLLINLQHPLSVHRRKHFRLTRTLLMVTSCTLDGGAGRRVVIRHHGTAVVGEAGGAAEGDEGGVRGEKGGGRKQGLGLSGGEPVSASVRRGRESCNGRENERAYGGRRRRFLRNRLFDGRIGSCSVKAVRAR
jgi:hypothetical protein